MLDDLLDFAGKKLKGKRGHHPSGTSRSGGGLRSMISGALDGDFRQQGSHGHGQPSNRWTDDSSDDRDFRRSQGYGSDHEGYDRSHPSRRRSSGGWDD